MRVDNLASSRIVARLLKEHGLQLKQRWGQNFLVDGNLADRIVAALDPGPNDGVVEIGPGLGVLTQRLLPRTRRVVAVEIDEGFVKVLQTIFQDEPRLQILHGDARQLDLGALLPPDVNRKAIGNLPYYATTPLLFRLLESEPPFSCLVLMVQKEVADRMAASPGGKAYGALTVNVQYRCRVERVLAVPPSVFFPPPDVHSAVVRLTKREETLPLPPKQLTLTVRAAFSQRRKTLRNALRSAFSPEVIQRSLVQSRLDGNRRPETLTVEEFVRLGAALFHHGEGDPSFSNETADSPEE